MGGNGQGWGISIDPWVRSRKIDLPEEGVKTSRKILVIRSLSDLQKLLSKFNEIFHPLFVHFCPLRVRLKVGYSGGVKR